MKVVKNWKLFNFLQLREKSGNTKGGSITVLFTSCLTGLELAVWQLTIFVFICKTDHSKPAKQEVIGTVILPPLVFPWEVKEMLLQLVNVLTIRKWIIRIDLSLLNGVILGLPELQKIVNNCQQILNVIRLDREKHSVDIRQWRHGIQLHDTQLTDTLHNTVKFDIQYNNTLHSVSKCNAECRIFIVMLSIVGWREGNLLGEG